MQDATVKWLVASYAVPQVLFIRSVIIIIVALVLGGRGNIRALAHSRNKMNLALRAAVTLLAWLAYYTAARHLALAQLTTIYFAAPIIVVILSVVMLRDEIPLYRWAAVMIGFAGVVLAVLPIESLSNLTPFALALLAAFLWAFSTILIRTISRSEPTTNLMLVSNGLFALVCGFMLLWLWKTPDLFSLSLMIGLGVAGGFGQFFLYEGFRYAPPSVIAPMEYTGLVWAFVYGYLIWADVPRSNVFVGAALILGSSLVMFWLERRRALQSVTLESIKPAL